MSLAYALYKPRANQKTGAAVATVDLADLGRPDLLASGPFVSVCYSHEKAVRASQAVVDANRRQPWLYCCKCRDIFDGISPKLNPRLEKEEHFGGQAMQGHEIRRDLPVNTRERLVRQALELAGLEV